jgi:hypothetical protein
MVGRSSVQFTVLRDTFLPVVSRKATPLGGVEAVTEDKKLLPWYGLLLTSFGSVIGNGCPKACLEGKAIMGTDGSVKDPTATYSFVISISRTDVKTNIKR